MTECSSGGIIILLYSIASVRTRGVSFHPPTLYTPSAHRRCTPSVYSLPTRQTIAREIRKRFSRSLAAATTVVQLEAHSPAEHGGRGQRSDGRSPSHRPAGTRRSVERARTGRSGGGRSTQVLAPNLRAVG